MLQPETNNHSLIAKIKKISVVEKKNILTYFCLKSVGLLCTTINFERPLIQGITSVPIISPCYFRVTFMSIPQLSAYIIMEKKIKNIEVC